MSKKKHTPKPANPQAPIEKTCHLNRELGDTEDLLATIAWALLEQKDEEANGIQQAVKQVTGREIWGLGGILDEAGSLTEMWRGNVFITILWSHFDDLLDRFDREGWAAAEARIMAQRAAARAA